MIKARTRRQLLSGSAIFLTGAVSGVMGSSGAANADGIISSGLDTVDGIVVNVDSDGDGPGLFAVVVSADYEGYGNPGTDPGSNAELRVEDGSVIMNGTTVTNGGLDVNGGIQGENFSVADGSGNTSVGGTLTVTGNTTTNGGLEVNGGIQGENFSVADGSGNTSVGGTLTVTGNTTTNGGLDVNGGIQGENFSVADGSGNTSVGGTLTVNDNLTLDTNGSSAGGTTIDATDSSLTMASQRTVVRGGTNSGVLTLDDGDVGDGTTLTIAGSGGGTAATVLQTTTNAATTEVTTRLGTSSGGYDQSTAIVQAAGNSITVDSGATGNAAAITIDGTVSGANTSNMGVLITGSGQNGIAYDPSTATAGPTWADVAMQSASFGDGDPSRGSAIIITDYGVQILSPQPAANETIYNSQFGNTGDGTVDNSIGLNSGNGTMLNTFGTAAPSSGLSSTVANEIGANYGAGTVSNTIGGGTSPTQNTVGNTNAATQTDVQAGASSLALRNNTAVLTGGTQGNNLTISNSGASFASGSGRPISVTGVADGVNEFDAVNIGQFGSAIASVAAMQAVPDMRPGETFAMGIGLGRHLDYSALAIGAQAYLGDNATFNFSAASGFRDTAPVFSAGLGWSW